MAFLYNQKLRKFTLTLLLLWSSIFYWLLNQNLAVNIIVVIGAVLCLLFIFYECYTQYIIIFLSFISSYVLYGYMLVNNLPVWLIMLGVTVIYIYLFAYMQQKVAIARADKMILLFIFALILIETFLFLGYFFISPVNRSLLLSLVVYLICGFSDKMIVENNSREMVPFLLVFAFVFVTMLLTASWGQI